MKNDPSDEQLNALLHSWKVDVEAPPGFTEGIWNRIALREAEAAAASWRARWQRWAGSLSQKTNFAWGAAAVVVTVSAVWMGLRPSPSHQSAPTSSAYLASIDPYRMTR